MHEALLRNKKESSVIKPRKYIHTQDVFRTGVDCADEVNEKGVTASRKISLEACGDPSAESIAKTSALLPRGNGVGVLRFASPARKKRG